MILAAGLSPMILASDSVQFEDIEASAGSGRRFRQVAYTGGLMRVPGYKYPIVLDLAGGDIQAGAKRPILLEHDRKQIAGQSDTVEVVDGEGLIVAGNILETDAGNEVISLANQGFEWQASVGAAPLAPPRLIQAGHKATVNGQEFEGPFYHVTKWRLGESSFVAMGADSNTSATFPIAASAGWGRVAGVPIQAAPAVHKAKNYDTNEQAIECAFLRTINCGAATEKQFSDEINSAADTMDGITIHGVFARAIAASGGSPTYERKAIYTKAMEGIQASSGHSTVSLPRVFANVLNKALLAQMNVVPTIYQNFVKVDSASDFREKTFIRLSGVGGFQRVGTDGELKHFELTDSQYSAKLKTFGNILGLSRQQLTNDDTGAFAQIPEIFGRAAKLAIEEEFHRALVTYFATQGTVTTYPGSGHPLATSLTSLQLSLESLQWILQLFRDQTDVQGLPMLTVPRHLLVPTALEIPVAKFMTQIAATKASDVNALAGMFTTHVSPYLANTKINPNGNQEDWYVFADPSALPAIVLLFLNGQQSPIFESAAMEFDIIGGMRWRGYWDFGFNSAEAQAAMKVDASAVKA